MNEPTLQDIVNSYLLRYDAHKWAVEEEQKNYKQMREIFLNNLSKQLNIPIRNMWIAGDVVVIEHYDISDELIEKIKPISESYCTTTNKKCLEFELKDRRKQKK